MAQGTLFNKVLDSHSVAQLSTGQLQIFIDLHLIHEVTSPQAFDMMRERKLKVAYPSRTFATMDHIVPTLERSRPFADPQAEEMAQAIEHNTFEFGIRYFNVASGRQGVVHIVGPELGLVVPGTTVVCGDSHTSTLGAFGTLAFGIGTSQVRDVLATQCIAMSPMKVRKIAINGKLNDSVTPKDVILFIINRLGAAGGIGYVYEYCGDVFDAMSMEGRMTVCNMTIEGGARAGYMNPDQITFDYLKDTEYSPKGEFWDKAVSIWKQFASDSNAEYDDIVNFNANEIEPMVTWGITPAQSVNVSQPLPYPAQVNDQSIRNNMEMAYQHMELIPGQKMTSLKIDVAFIGSCTNGRITDLRAAAGILKGKKIARDVKAMVVPGSMLVQRQAIEEGLDKIFTDAGFEWRLPGCSMCIAINPDQLTDNQICASTSNRNFIGRQGSQSGRTLLMSPAMVAAAAINGHVSDVRNLF